MKIKRRLFSVARPVLREVSSPLAIDIQLAKRIAAIRADVIRKASPPAQSETPSPFVAQQLAVQKWKISNADESNDNEALAPAAFSLIERPAAIVISNRPNDPATQYWLAISFGDFVVRIVRNPKRLTGPHEIFLHERICDMQGQTHVVFPAIAGAFTQEFVFTLKARALEQYFRVLCEDIF